MFVYAWNQYLWPLLVVTDRASYGMVEMNNGTIEQVGTPAEVYDRPASLYVAGFIGSPAMNFLPGRYDAARRGVVLEDGRCLPVFDVHAVGDGQLVQLGIRPEHARLVPQGQGLFDARVDLIEELGAARLCNLMFEDILFCLLTDDRPDLIAGATVAVQFPPRKRAFVRRGDRPASGQKQRWRKAGGLVP